MWTKSFPMFLDDHLDWISSYLWPILNLRDRGESIHWCASWMVCSAWYLFNSLLQICSVSWLWMFTEDHKDHFEHLAYMTMWQKQWINRNIVIHGDELSLLQSLKDATNTFHSRQILIFTIMHPGTFIVGCVRWDYQKYR